MANQKGRHKQGKHRGGNSVPSAEQIIAGGTTVTPTYLNKGSLGARAPKTGKAPTCCECGTTAVLKTGRDVYRNCGGTGATFLGNLYWKCPSCHDSHCGCQPHSDTPLGRPGDPRTRAARSATHLVFDPLWKQVASEAPSPTAAAYKRSAAYTWLAATMGIPVEECHIGLFDFSRCLQAMAVIAARTGKPK